MLTMESHSIAELAQADAALAPCPFCGGAAVFERHVAVDEIVRVACGSARCTVHPATEYLLEEYRHDLVEAWNTRAPRR